MNWATDTTKEFPFPSRPIGEGVGGEVINSFLCAEKVSCGVSNLNGAIKHTLTKDLARNVLRHT